MHVDSQSIAIELSKNPKAILRFQAHRQSIHRVLGCSKGASPKSEIGHHKESTGALQSKVAIRFRAASIACSVDPKLAKFASNLLQHPERPTPPNEPDFPHFGKKPIALLTLPGHTLVHGFFVPQATKKNISSFPEPFFEPNSVGLPT